MTKNNQEKLIVLTYHKIFNAEKFEKQIKYLNNNYNIISINEILNPSSQTSTNVLITFDDGDMSNYLKAFPILKKFKIPAILFVVTDLINSNKPFWWEEIEYYLGKESGNKKVWEVKNWPNKKRESFLQELRRNSEKPELIKEQLTTAQLREMQKEGIIIANHSHTHPIFDQCTLEELEDEMEKSRFILKDLGFSAEIFAYPNGNYSPKTEAVLEKYGVKQAYLFNHEINQNFNPLRISRLIVNDNTPMWKFKLILSGLHSRILPFTRFAGKLKGRLKK